MIFLKKFVQIKMTLPPIATSSLDGFVGSLRSLQNPPPIFRCPTIPHAENQLINPCADVDKCHIIIKNKMYLTLNIYNSFILWYNVEKLIINKGCEIMGTMSLYGYITEIIEDKDKNNPPKENEPDSPSKETVYQNAKNYLNNIFSVLELDLSKFNKIRQYRKYNISENMQSILEDKIRSNKFPTEANIIDILSKKTITDSEERAQRIELVTVIEEFLLHNFTQACYEKVKREAIEKLEYILAEIKKDEKSIQDELEKTQHFSELLNYNIKEMKASMGDRIGFIMNAFSYIVCSSEFPHFYKEYVTDVLEKAEELFYQTISNKSDWHDDRLEGQLSGRSVQILELLRYSEYLPALLKQIQFESQIRNNLKS